MGHGLPFSYDIDDINRYRSSKIDIFECFATSGVYIINSESLCLASPCSYCEPVSIIYIIGIIGVNILVRHLVN